MSNLTILTYNILSQNLAQEMLNEKKNNVQIYNSDIMSKNYRWNLISNYISNRIEESKANPSNNLIICLQEVTEEWVEMFAILFASVNYGYLNVQHGRSFNGNMGVLMAYPLKLFIIKSEFYHIGAHIQITNSTSKKILPYIPIASAKSNIAIIIAFEDKQLGGQPFVVTTYHMPCAPQTPEISLIHSKILYKKTLKFGMKIGKNIPLIIAGDFNMTSNFKAYEYLSTKMNCIWHDNFKHWPITNHSYVLNYEFAGCIDYIFYSNAKCLNVIVRRVKNIIPDILEPSDHIPITAYFII